MMNTFQTCNQHINKGCWSWMQSFSNRDICNKNKSELAEFGAKKNHVHLIVDLHPDNNISQLIDSLKSASSRIIRKDFAEEYYHWYPKSKVFWGR